MAFYDEFDDPTNFVISFTPNPKGDFGVFAKGYTLAANRLSGLLLEAPRFSDYEAYPVVFLYRHALELSLKHIIYSSLKLAHSSISTRSIGGCRTPITLRSFREPSKLYSLCCFQRMRVFVKRLQWSWRPAMSFRKSIHDPTGTVIRSTAKGSARLQEHQMINLRAFADRMSSVLEGLDAIHFGLNIETDVAQEVYEAVESLLASVVKGEES